MSGKQSSSSASQPAASTSYIDQKPSVPINSTPQTQEGSQKCYTIRFCSVETEAEALEILNKLKSAKYSDDIKLSSYKANDGILYYRVMSGCFETAQEASSELKIARQTAQQLNIKHKAIMMSLK